MKRSFIIMVFFFLIVLRSAFASPACGTQLPLKKEMFLGLQHSFIKRQNLSNDLGYIESHQNYFSLSYGLTDWLVLDLKASLYSSFRYHLSGGGGIKYEDPLWGGGYGFRVKAYEYGPIKSVVGFQHFSIHPRTVHVAGEKVQGILEDWQGSALFSYDMKRLSPYIGFRYMMMDYIRLVNKDRKMIKSEKGSRPGFLSGMDIPLSQKTWLNVEVDWQDGGAVAAGVYCRF